MKVVFGVVRNLEVPVLLRTPYIDRFVMGIFPPEWKIISYNFKPISILATRTYQKNPRTRIRIRHKL